MSVTITIVKFADLPASGSWLEYLDPYVRVLVDNTLVFGTPPVLNTATATLTRDNVITVTSYKADSIAAFEIWDSNVLEDRLVGTTTFELSELFNSKVNPLRKDFKLAGGAKPPTLTVEFLFTPPTNLVQGATAEALIEPDKLNNFSLNKSGFSNDVQELLGSLKQLGEGKVPDQLKRVVGIVVSRVDFEWVHFKEGVPPHCVIPPISSLISEQFFQHTLDIVKSDLPGILALAFAAVAWSEGPELYLNPFKYYEDLLGAMTKLPGVAIAPGVKEHWNDDDLFGYERLNGLDPTTIRKVSSWPYTLCQDANIGPHCRKESVGSIDKIPGLTDELAKKVLAPHFKDASSIPSLKTLADTGRLFVTDYSQLQIVVNKTDPARQPAAPIALFWLKEESLGDGTLKKTLLPLAIQLKQPQQLAQPLVAQPNLATYQNPIFTPLDPPGLWTAAKVYCNCAKVNHHEVWSHLGRTHLTMETCWLACRRTLAAAHPVAELLRPTFFFTLPLNALARLTLIAEDNGLIQELFMPNQAALDAFLVQQWQHFSFQELDVPKNIAARGLEKLAASGEAMAHHDSLHMWKVIRAFVEDVLSIWYTGVDDVIYDEEVQAWVTLLTAPAGPVQNENVLQDTINQALKDVGGLKTWKGAADALKDIRKFFSAEGGAAFKGFPWQTYDATKRTWSGKLTKNSDLYDFLTAIIFNCSVAHGMVNNGQFDYMSWIPNSPVRFDLPLQYVIDVKLGLDSKNSASSSSAAAHVDPLGEEFRVSDIAMTTIARHMPRESSALRSVLVSHALTAPTDDLLGHYKPDFFEGSAVVAKKVEKYKQQLARVSDQISLRNEKQGGGRPYAYCNPLQLAQGISI